MATAYSELYSKFLVNVQDYKMDILATAATPTLETYLFGFLELAIPDFTNCQQDLEDRDDEESTFNITLTGMEQKILVNWMTYHWYLREVNNILQMNTLLRDSDFDSYSNAQGLKTKSTRANEVREINYQYMVEYGISEIPWDDWLDGNYG